MPIYLVKQGDTERLIDASNKAAAIRCYVTPLVVASVASTADLFRLAKAGAVVEHASAGESVVVVGEGAALHAEESIALIPAGARAPSTIGEVVLDGLGTDDSAEPAQPNSWLAQAGAQA